MPENSKYSITDLNKKTYNITIPEIVHLQNQWRPLVSLNPLPCPPKKIAGADVTFSPDGEFCWAVVAVMSFPGLDILETAQVKIKVTFPYVPGLLSFREAPAIVSAMEKLSTQPDILMVDGQGLAHPRRMGLATHLGLMLGMSTIGCAKSRLIGEYRTPGLKKGASCQLIYQGNVVGRAVRTRDHVKPLFISVGHLISLPQAVHLVLKCCRGYRLPEPTRQAHRIVTQLRRTFTGHPLL